MAENYYSFTFRNKGEHDLYCGVAYGLFVFKKSPINYPYIENI